jgi:hypothetical protein
MTSQVKIVLRNPVNKLDLVDYTMQVQDHALGRDWLQSLKQLLQSGNLLEKNFCFMGFPNGARNINYLVTSINRHIQTINQDLPGYNIKLTFTEQNVFARDYADNGVNHVLFNQLHNHFEILQGTVDNLSPWYRAAKYNVKYAIRQLNNICHEMENLILSLRKSTVAPEWMRPSQITTWINAPRLELSSNHRQGFVTNGYDRVLGGVYMHWAQIGKTLFEVFRDEHAPKLTTTICEAITHLKYYSGEFDIEWGNDVTMSSSCPWHVREQTAFKAWLLANNNNPADPSLSLGYLPVAQVDLVGSFGTTDYKEIWDILGAHLDIYSVEVDGVTAVYDYCWNDSNHEQRQIDQLKPGYDYQLRNIT